MITLTKKELNQYFSLSSHLVISLVEENEKFYKIEISGDKNKVKKSDFESTVFDFIKNQKDFYKITNFNTKNFLD